MVAGWEMARLTVAPYLVMVAAATLAGLRYRLFGPGFKGFSLVFTALLVLALLPFGPAGLLGMLGTVWVMVAGLVLAFGNAKGDHGTVGV